MKKLFPLFIIFFLLPCFAEMNPDIPPEKGDITKNIHVLFDRSGSMGMTQLAAAYKEVEAIVMQNTDEFNIAVSVFGTNHLRLKVKDKECKLGENWMAMPSMLHYKTILNFVENAPVDGGSTQITTAIEEIVKENKQNVTIIVISDCDIEDIYRPLATLKKSKTKFKVGFVNVTRRIATHTYQAIKENGCWYIRARDE